MVNLRRLDAFTKTRPDLQQKSVGGGIITLVALSAALLLLIGQIGLYIRGDTRHSLTLSKSISIPLIPLTEHNSMNVKMTNKLMSQQGRFALNIHVTFPHIACEKLEVSHDGASLSTGELEKIHGSHTLTLRRPTFSELKKIGRGLSMTTVNSGCTIIGTLQPFVVAGSFSINMNLQSWAEATTALTLGLYGEPSDSQTGRVNPFQGYNVSHYIHSIRFGNTLPKSSSLDRPLEDLPHIIENDFYGLAVAQTQVKLIPTSMEGSYFNDQLYQMSVVDIIIQPQTLVAHGTQQLPGLTVTYDFTPLAVHHSEGRPPFLVFLSSLISIVGGVFVTVGMLTGCVVHSAQEIAKKID